MLIICTSCFRSRTSQDFEKKESSNSLEFSRLVSRKVVVLNSHLHYMCSIRYYIITITCMYANRKWYNEPNKWLSTIKLHSISLLFDCAGLWTFIVIMIVRLSVTFRHIIELAMIFLEQVSHFNTSSNIMFWHIIESGVIFLHTTCLGMGPMRGTLMIISIGIGTMNLNYEIVVLTIYVWFTMLQLLVLISLTKIVGWSY